MLHQSEAVPNTVVASTVMIGSVATGLDFGVLLAGFAGGLVSLSFLPPMGLWRRIWTPVTATLTAGYTAPMAVHYLSGIAGASVDHLALQAACAFGVGVLAQVLIPVAMRAAQRRADRFEKSEE